MFRVPALIFALAAAAGLASAQDAGTLVIINTSGHRTGKIQIFEGKQLLGKVGQHRWVEVPLPAGEHVIHPMHESGRELVLSIKPGTRTYVTVNFRFGVAMAYPELVAASDVEGQHWTREYPTQ